MSDSAGPVARPDFHVEMRRNQWHTLVILLAFAALILVVGLVIDVLVGLGVVGAVVVVLLAAGLPAAARARPADPAAFQRSPNLVEGLCIAAGLPKPTLYVVDDPALNALAAG